MKKIFVIIFTILILGCQPILRTVTGIKKPTVENINTIENYIKETNLNIDNTRNFYLSSFDDYKKLSKLRDTLFRLPDIYLFKKSGHFIEENLFCFSLKSQANKKSNENYYNYIYEVDSLVSEDKNIQFLEEFLVTSKNENVIFDKKNDIAIILWAKFLGDKRNLKHIENSKKTIEESDLDINIYYLNIDTMDFWE